MIRHAGRQARAIPALVDKLQLALQGTIPTPLSPCPIINYLFVGISFVTLTLRLFYAHSRALRCS